MWLYQAKGRLTEVHVPQSLVSLGSMEASQDRQRVHDADGGTLALFINVALCELCEVLTGLDIADTRVIREGGGEGEECIMKHWGIMRSFWRDLRLWNTKCPPHVPKEQRRDDS